MNLRILGLFALLGAPFLCIAFLTFGTETDTQKRALDGFFSILYISGWMCAILGLWQAEATGQSRWGRLVLLIQLLFLSLANISNIMLLLQVGLRSPVYFILDLFWPVSNIWMLATGITVLTARRLQGVMRFVPLVVGLWLPVTVLCMTLMGKDGVSMICSGVYSAIAWTCLGLVILRLASKQTFLKPHMA